MVFRKEVDIFKEEQTSKKRHKINECTDCQQKNGNRPRRIKRNNTLLSYWVDSKKSTQKSVITNLEIRICDSLRIIGSSVECVGGRFAENQP